MPVWAAGVVIAINNGMTALGAGITSQILAVSAPTFASGQGVWGMIFVTAGQAAIGQVIF